MNHAVMAARITYLKDTQKTLLSACINKQIIKEEEQEKPHVCYKAFLGLSTLVISHLVNEYRQIDSGWLSSIRNIRRNMHMLVHSNFYQIRHCQRDLHYHITMPKISFFPMQQKLSLLQLLRLVKYKAKVCRFRRLGMYLKCNESLLTRYAQESSPTKDSV